MSIPYESADGQFETDLFQEHRQMTDGRGVTIARMLQLGSAMLPVGAYAYSDGLETAVAQGLVHDEDSLEQWLNELLDLSMQRLEVPVYKRLYDCWIAQAYDEILDWNDFLIASRESAELRAADAHAGHALLRLAGGLGLEIPIDLGKCKAVAFATTHALLAIHWSLGAREAAQVLLWSLLEARTLAAVKLVPLGQTAGQLVLMRLAGRLDYAVERGFSMQCEEIGASLPMLAIMSMGHECAYTRLFRS